MDGWSGAWVAEVLTVEEAVPRTRRQKVTETLLEHFAKHTKQLNYREPLARGRAIGSGTVEFRREPWGCD